MMCVCILRIFLIDDHDVCLSVHIYRFCTLIAEKKREKERERDRERKEKYFKVNCRPYNYTIFTINITIDATLMIKLRKEKIATW